MTPLLEFLVSELQAAVDSGAVTLQFDGDNWYVGWHEVHPDTAHENNPFRRECWVDGDYSDLAEAIDRALEMIREGLPAHGASCSTRTSG